MDDSLRKRGLPTPLPRHLSMAPAWAALSDASASTSLAAEVQLATGSKYKRRGPPSHRGPAPSLLELRRAAAKLRGR